MRRVLAGLFGLAAIALGLFVILGEQFAGTSADATVNAQALVLRAPIAGTRQTVWKRAAWWRPGLCR